MALQLYSKLFLTENDFTGEAAFEVPSNYTAVVRDIDATVKGPSAGAFIWAYDTDGVQFWAWASGVVTDPAVANGWRGRQVIPGPGYLYISTDADVSFRASGYLLTGAAP